MNKSQKTIKYIAMALATLLAILIVSGIASAVLAVVSVISGNKETLYRDDEMEFSQTYKNINSLDITNDTGNLRIKVGDTFKVEAQNVSKHFEARLTEDGRLVVSEDESDNWFFKIDGISNKESRITVTLPRDFIAEEAKLNMGVGSVDIEALSAEYLYISAGAGSIVGSNLVADEVKIEGGIGSVKLRDVSFENMYLECGMGNLDLEGVLIGDNTIECGIGMVDLDLQGDVDDYRLDIDNGLGIIKLNGKKVSNSYQSEESARNLLKIEGGIGNVDIRIKD